MERISLLGTRVIAEGVGSTVSNAGRLSTSAAVAPETVQLSNAAGRLGEVDSGTDRPLPPERGISYGAC